MRIASIVALCLMVVAAPAQDVPNPGFEDGAAGDPDGWSLNQGTGAWEMDGRDGGRCISVTGGGDNEASNFWLTDDLVFKPGETYRISLWMKVALGTSGGTIMTGPSFANRDYGCGETWEEKSFVFAVPEEPGNSGYLRFGQWEKGGTVYFDDIGLTKVQPIHATTGDIELGAGETIEGGRYEFQSRLNGQGSNYSRCLFRNGTGFNSNRWLLANGSSVICRHDVGGMLQDAAEWSVNVGHYTSGVLHVEASTDAENWTEVGQLDQVGSVTGSVPEDLLPASEIYIRLSCSGRDEATESPAPGSLQVYGYTYSATLDGDVDDCRGNTQFIELIQPNDGYVISSLSEARPGENAMGIRIAGAEPDRLAWRVVVEPANGPPAESTGALRDLVDGQDMRIPYTVERVGAHVLTVSISDPAKPEPVFVARTQFTVPDLYAADFGYSIGDGLWWCESPYKISRERPAPRDRRPAVELSAARNEYEPVQLVVRPASDLTDLMATVTDLEGPRGGTIPADAITIDRVAYVNVQVPTDPTGCEGLWPDPLPPLTEPFDAEAGVNHPLWITVKVPKGVPAGRYEGDVRLTADGYEETVPLRLRVYDFDLPDETHVESGFGLSSGPLRQYHNLDTNEEVREVYDLYLRNFADHRISPYNPTPFDPIRVTFSGIDWTGGDIVSDEAAEGVSSMKIVDENDSGVVQVGTREQMAIEPGSPYTVRWSCRTDEPGQPYLVTVQTYDVVGQWISGNNKDFSATGSGEWKREERAVATFGDEVRSVVVILRPASWSEPGEALGTAWFDDIELVAPGGDNLIPSPGFEAADSDVKVDVDFADFDRAAAYAFDELKLNSFRLSIEGMGGGTFHSRHYGSIGPYKQGSPGYESLMSDYLGQVEAHLREKGWLEKAYFYWFDEPTAKDYDFVIEGMDLLKRHIPGVRRMLTEEPVPPLHGVVDLWCPVLSSMDAKSCADRIAEGERIWWYVCTGPKAPYPTLFIDHSAIEMRLWLWMTWKWDIDGVLIWASNYWSSPLVYSEGVPQDPWDDPMSYQSGYGLPVGHVGYWGNGDGRMVYPPNQDGTDGGAKRIEGPVNCIRWELLREGIEDYEYFYLLRELSAGKPAAKLLEVPETIVVDKTNFTRDPQPLLKHRVQIAEAIEKLSRGR